jgi:hypothetical protein
VLGAAAFAGVLLAGATLWSTRPPALAEPAVQAAASTSGTVFADWRWAPQLQRDLGQGHRVLPVNGLGSESPDFWLDYVRITQDYERWPEELRDLNVDVLVLPAEDGPLLDQVRASTDWHIIYDQDNVLVAARQAT